jgi:putative peptidoglycan lipid II flippase
MSLARSSLVVGLASVLSRLLGFARDVLLAQALGAGPLADAFLAAFRLPNLVRRVLGEGGLHPAIVPALAGRGDPEAARIGSEILTGLTVAMLALMILAQLGAGLLALIAAPGLWRDPAALALATGYTRILLPLAAATTLAGALGAVLAARRLFTAAALAGLVVNAALVAALLGPVPAWIAEGHWLAIAASLGGLVQLLVLIVAARRQVPGLRWRMPAASGRLVPLVRRGLVAAATGASIQLFVLAGAQVASFLPSGLSWLHYADRVAQLPTGIIAALAGIVLLPEMAARDAAGDREGLLALQREALVLALLVACPAAAGLALLADPIAGVLFERGAFGPVDRAGTAAALAGLALLIPAAAAGKVLAQALYARGALRAVAIATLAGFVLALVAGAVLGPWLGIVGVALGTALGAVLHTALLVLALKAQGLWRGDGLGLRLGRIVAATLLMVLGLLPVKAWLLPSALSVALLCVLGVLLFAGSAFLCGAVPPDWQRLLAKSRPGHLARGARALR